MSTLCFIQRWMEGHFQAETKCGTLAADNFCGDAGKQKPNLDFLQLDSSAESQFKLVEFKIFPLLCSLERGFSSKQKTAIVTAAAVKRFQKGQNFQLLNS